MAMARSMRAQNRFNEKPKTTDFSGGSLDERGRNKSIKTAFNAVDKELDEHRSQGIMIEPIRRAKIADRLKRDHHAGARRAGKERQIIKGRHE